jgi:hypothetical protein
VTSTAILTPVTYSLAQDQSLINQPAIQQEPVDLSILDVNASALEDIDTYTIIGKVLNNGTVPYHDVSVSATLYNNEGESLVERSAHTSPSGIQPGTNASFSINIFGISINGGIDVISNFTLKVTGDRQEPLFR